MIKTGTDFSRPAGRLSFSAIVVLCVWLTPCLHAAQPATTVINDVVYRADGAPAQGTILLSWPAFVTADHKAVAAGAMSVTLGPGGALNLALAPNQGATPPGTYYKATLKLNDGTTNTEAWVVPTTSPTTVSAIRASVVPTASAGQYATVSYVDTQNAAQDAVTVTKLGRQGDTPVTLASVRYASQFANIQSAINDAGTSGAVLIPSTYAGADTYTNSAGVPVLDLRQGRLTVSDLATQRPCADVRASGAKGDGVTDDSAAIQAWINAIPDGGCGFVPPNFRMRITTSVQIYLRHKIKFYSPTGQGSSSDCTTAGFNWAGANDGVLIDINRSRGLVFEGLAFCGWATGSSTLAGTVVRIDQNLAGSSLITSDILFQRDYFNSKSRAGAKLVAISPSNSGNNQEDIRFENSTFFGNFDLPATRLTDCITIGNNPNAKNIRITGNFIGNCRVAITELNGSWKIEDNEFTTNDLDFKLTGWTDPSTFKGNISENSKQGIDGTAASSTPPLEISGNNFGANTPDLTKTFVIMPLNATVDFRNNNFDFVKDGSGCPDPSLRLLGFPDNNQTRMLSRGTTVASSCYNIEKDLALAKSQVDDFGGDQTLPAAGSPLTIGGVPVYESWSGRIQARHTNGLRRPLIGINLDLNQAQQLGGLPCAIDGTSTCLDHGGIEIASVMQPGLTCSVVGAGGGANRMYALVAKDANGNRAMVRHQNCATPASYDANNYVALSWLAAPGATSYDILAANPADGSFWGLVANTTSTSYDVTTNPAGPYNYSKPAYNETTIVKVRGVTQPVAQGTPAGNPPSGQFWTYVKSGSGLCQKASSGTETCFGSGGGGSTDWNNPGTIGATTPNTGKFTQVTIAQDGTNTAPALTFKNGSGGYTSGNDLAFQIATAGGCYFYQFPSSVNGVTICDGQLRAPAGNNATPGIRIGSALGYGFYAGTHSLSVGLADSDAGFYVAVGGSNIVHIDSKGYCFGAGSVCAMSGPGSPEGVVAASVGSTWYRTDGGAGTSIYFKESGTGNTGWVASGALVAYLKATNNLSDLASAATARANLGLGTSAVKDAFGSVPGVKVASTDLGADPTTDNCVKWVAGGKLGDAGTPCGGGGSSVTGTGFWHSTAGSLDAAARKVALNDTNDVTGTTAVGNGGTGVTTISGIVKGNGTSAFSAATAGTDYVSPSSTETLTNKTLDAEGSGNVITIPTKVWLPAAGCNNATASPFWDLPTSTPASPACVTGTNTQKGVLDYADTSGGFSAQNTLLLPADFTGNIDARIIWTTSATSGNAKWSLSTACTDVAASATDDPAFNTASTVTTAAPGTANRVQVSSISAATITGCNPGNLLHIKLFRDGNDAADTIAATARLIGVELTIRRAM